jgi:hypothetical protein
MTTTTLDRSRTFREVLFTTCGAFLAEETTSEWAPEEEVLTTPEVQEALAQAIVEFEHWKNSL